MRQIVAHAEKIEGGSAKIGELSKAVRAAEEGVAVWLTVLARCFELQEQIAVLELEQVLSAAPDRLDGHREGLIRAREERREQILQRTAKLMTRLDAAAGDANLNVLLHLQAARRIVDAVNRLGAAVSGFHEPLGISPDRELFDATPLRDAIRDPDQWKKAGKEAGPKAIAGAAMLGAGALFVIPQTRAIATKTVANALKVIR